MWGYTNIDQVRDPITGALQHEIRWNPTGGATINAPDTGAKIGEIRNSGGGLSIHDPISGARIADIRSK